MGAFYHRTAMRSHPTLAALVVLLALPGSAQAAEIQVDRPCYADPSQRQDTVTLTGSGFRPDATYQVTLDGEPLPNGTGQTDAQGNVRGTFTAPALTGSSKRRRFVLGVQEGDNQPTAAFKVAKLFADFAPSGGDPRSLKVRFSLYGFSLGGGEASPAVYVHYLTPGGRRKKTVALGRATGPCGSLSRTARKRLFPFEHPVAGLWKLQFDTNKTYVKGAKDSPFLFYTVGVKVRASS